MKSDKDWSTETELGRSGCFISSSIKFEGGKTVYNVGVRHSVNSSSGFTGLSRALLREAGC